MSLFRTLQAVSSASGTGAIDWDAVGDAAKAATDPGSLDMSDAEVAGYARDVGDARQHVRAVTGLSFDLPETVEVHHRHHWIDANLDTFRRVMTPIEENAPVEFTGATRIVNTGTLTVLLSFLANHVLGQYDPLLLAESDEHELYFVRPNIQKTATLLDVPYDRFRRWIAFHEVAHAAEFGAAPWLPEYLETHVRRGLDGLTSGSIDREALRTIDTTMTAVEGYAELVMDRAFDQESKDLREKLEARRRGGGPITVLARRFLGLGMKRRQYERGKRFFDHVVDVAGMEAAGRVWEGPAFLPTDAELDRPDSWLYRTQ